MIRIANYSIGWQKQGAAGNLIARDFYCVYGISTYRHIWRIKSSEILFEIIVNHRDG